jgi:hypothetical protein
MRAVAGAFSSAHPDRRGRQRRLSAPGSRRPREAHEFQGAVVDGLLPFFDRWAKQPFAAFDPVENASPVDVEAEHGPDHLQHVAALSIPVLLSEVRFSVHMELNATRSRVFRSSEMEKQGIRDNP